MQLVGHCEAKLMQVWKNQNSVHIHSQPCSTYVNALTRTLFVKTPVDDLYHRGHNPETVVAVMSATLPGWRAGCALQTPETNPIEEAGQQLPLIECHPGLQRRQAADEAAQRVVGHYVPAGQPLAADWRNRLMLQPLQDRRPLVGLPV